MMVVAPPTTFVSTFSSLVCSNDSLFVLLALPIANKMLDAGNCAVGKSSMSHRLARGDFAIGGFSPTTGLDLVIHTLRMCDKRIRVRYDFASRTSALTCCTLRICMRFSVLFYFS